ncbi:hypothetical protein ACQV5M_18865, partial [Leptospira sp. SA-E8]|uniref:hypothetical protein n=1 Tax=Leptospira sp. SA-E8 TaxID=3422259 RepID=UPI003EBF17FF
WHFAYYAELRAAQSILAAAGCGIFNTWNAVIDTGGQVIQVDDLPHRGRSVLGTHSMTWLALPIVLTNSPGGQTALSNAAEILGYSLADLVAYAFPGQSATQTASRWITDWTFDIKLGSGDRDFRNRCSYDPHLVTPHKADIDDVVSFVEAFWTSFQPSPGAYFLDLDKHLLRRALIDQAKEKLTRSTGSAAPTEVEISAEIESAYDRMCSSAPPLASVPKAFFAQPVAAQNELLVASGDRNTTPTNPQPALSRASLLLRMATGISRRLLIDAGYQHGTELDSWFSALAIDQGFVASYQDIAGDRASLYNDSAVATEDLRTAYIDATAPVARTTVINHPRVKPHTACEASRIAHWGLQP